MQAQRTSLEPGMLLLGRWVDTPGEPLDCVWTVTGKRTIICHRDGLNVKATLKKSALPPEWKVINNAPLAKHLREQPRDAFERALAEGAQL